MFNAGLFCNVGDVLPLSSFGCWVCCFPVVCDEENGVRVLERSLEAFF